MIVHTKGADLFVSTAGSETGEPVVLCHSLATDQTTWRFVTPLLIDLGYRVILFDLRGHGRSTATSGAYTLDLLADDVVTVLDGLGIPVADYVGLSIGGMIGQVLGLKHADRFRTLTLAATTSRIPPASRPLWEARVVAVQEGGMESQVEPTIERWFTDEFRQCAFPVIDDVRAMIRTTSVDGYVGCCEAIRALDLTDELDRITTPTLVISGAADPGAPPAAGMAIRERISHARFELIEGAAHQIALEQPEAFLGVLTGFLVGAARPES